MNLYVLAWTAIAGLGALLSLYLAMESLFDLRALRPLKNGRRTLARGRFASESIRFLVHAAYFGIGLASLSAPVRPGTEVTIFVLLGGNLGLIINSLISVYVRQQVEVLVPPSLTAEAVVDKATATAEEVRKTAEMAALRVLEIATEAASELDRAELAKTLRGNERVARAAERTAANTERIAENTEPQ